MFLFNKNNPLPRSRQSSVDSHATDPSTSDAWASQSSDLSSSFEDMPSPEENEKALHGKRTSLLNLRSRSNTANSIAPSFASSMARPDSSSRRSSQDLRSFAGQMGFGEPSGSRRSLFSRGKRPKRQSSQFSSTYTLDEVSEMDNEKRSSVIRKDRNKRDAYGSQNMVNDIRPLISPPFGFQHLTHTERNQFAALDRTSQNELMAEFWAVRASQTPRQELHGIKAETLHFQNFSSEAVNEMATSSRSASAPANSPPPLSPTSSSHINSPVSPRSSAPTKEVRHSRSVESFSRPVVKPPTHRYTQSLASPPPRVSSRLALARVDDRPDDPSDESQTVFGSSRGRYKRSSGVWDRTASSRMTSEGSMASVMEDVEPIAQAVTTPDDTAIPALSPGFSPDLENVPEEPERFFNPRPAPRPPVRTPTMESFSFRDAQRSPTFTRRPSSRVSPYGSPKSPAQPSPRRRPISQMSDTLGSPFQPQIPRNTNRQSFASRRQSSYWKTLETSWEDDIDYCYEHAAEADCDFDWDQDSVGCESEDRDPTPERSYQRSSSPTLDRKPVSEDSENDATLRTRFFPGAFRPCLLVPSATNVPELDHRSALSSSTTDTSVLTPSDILKSPALREARGTEFNEPEGFSLTPSLLVPQDFKYHSMREEMYDDLLADYEGSDRHYTILEPAQSVAGSSRSSAARLSKRSSYDSSFMSASASLSSPIRRSASSSGSLPELVHSRWARKNFDVVVDQLSEQVASFSGMDEEDEEEEEDEEDATPPGRTVAVGRTLFACEEEDLSGQARPECLRSVSENVIASSEPADAYRLSNLHHERAASDGAAKLPASTMSNTPTMQPAPKSRTRAASSSKAMKSGKQPYLSLFPVPPRHR